MMINFISKVSESWKKKELIPVSEFAELHRYLPISNSISGKWTNSNSPHAVEIMDEFLNPDTDGIVIMGSAQIAKTEILLNILLYLIVQKPSSIMIMYPSQTSATNFVKLKLDAMLAECPILDGIIAEKKSRDSSNTLTQKQFLGGNISIVTAGSNSALRGVSAKYLFADEISAIETTVSDEGDAISRLLKRGTSYPDSKFIFISTPTIAGEDRIEHWYNKGSKAKYFSKCIHCNQEILLDHTMFDEDKNSIFCPKCGVEIDESDRQYMLKYQSKWVHEDYNNKIKSYHLNQLQSVLSSIKNVSTEIKSAGNDDEKLEVLYNTVYGLPYEPVRGEMIEPEIVPKRSVSSIEINNLKFVKKLMSVDVQSAQYKSRFEVAIAGVTADNKIYIIHHDKIMCDVTQQSSYNKLSEFIKDNSITHCFIDASHMTDNVYKFTDSEPKASPIMGVSHRARRIAESDKHSKLILLNVNEYKHQLFNDLVKEYKDGKIFFSSMVLRDDFIDQLLAERIYKVKSGGFDIPVFKQPYDGKPNEALDLTVYLIALNEYTKNVVGVVEEQIIFAQEEEDDDDDFTITVRY